MSVIRVGSTSKYADGWDHIFGGSAEKTKTRATTAKRAGKKRTKKAVKKATAKTAKKKSKRR